MIKLIPVKEIAKQCDVEEATVTKWIREDKIQAEKIGKKWMIRADVFQIFMNNGRQMPEDCLPIMNMSPDGEDIGGNAPSVEVELLREMSSIATFSFCESGKNTTTLKSPKIPAEWSPRIARIVNKVKQYEDLQTNFIRHAVWTMLLKMEKCLEENGHKSDPVWEVYNEAQARNARFQGRKKAIDEIRLAAKRIKSTKDKAEWANFLAEIKPKIDMMPIHWRNQAMAILKGKEVQRNREEDEE
jgi:excisionase family DNA binding protein